MQAVTNDNIHILKNLLSTNRIVITSHHNPDGDAIGSVLALYHLLSNMGISSTIVIPNEIPEFLAWLPGTNSAIRYSKQKEKAKKIIFDAEVLFALDYNGPSRLEDMSRAFIDSKAKKILIDHHPDPENAFDWTFSETKASSTAELIYEFACLIGSEHHIDKNCAECIFTGIMTDTGSFSYACSNPRTFEIVSKLISLGVEIEKIQQKVYNNFSADRMKLLGHSLLSNMKVFPEYRAAYISLTRDELKKFNYKIGDTEGLVNYPLSIKNIIFSALFIENSNHVKVSLRSVGNFPANKISEQYFNGGGHLNAAGGKSFASMNDTEKVFMEILSLYKDDLNE
jgi:bifunctional oligoribonuclease and PAP phosphatase NrnA